MPPGECWSKLVMLLPPTDNPADDAYELLRAPKDDCDEMEP